VGGIAFGGLECVSGLMGYLSITGMLGMVMEQCFVRHGSHEQIAVGGGMVGFVA